jgi:hypothetical protein
VSRSSTAGGARGTRFLEWKLDSHAPLGMLPLHFHITMGQQLNKYQKRKRRAAYLKRRKTRLKATVTSKKK